MIPPATISNSFNLTGRRIWNRCGNFTAPSRKTTALIRAVDHSDHYLRVIENLRVRLCDSSRKSIFTAAKGENRFFDLVQAVQKSFRRERSPPVEFKTAYYVDINQIAEMYQVYLVGGGRRIGRARLLRRRWQNPQAGEEQAKYSSISSSLAS